MSLFFAKSEITHSHVFQNIALFFTFCGKSCGKAVEKSQNLVDNFVEKFPLLTPCGKVGKLSTGYPQEKPSYPHFYPQGKSSLSGSKIHFSTVSTGPTTTTTNLLYL